MIKRHYLIQFWMLFILFVLTLATNYYDITDRRDSVNAHVQMVKKKPALPVEPIPKFKPVERFTYPEAVPRSSPFKAGKPVAGVNKGVGPDPNRPREPLEAYALDALKFSGVLEEGLRRWAIITLPGGGVARIKVGNYMGKNDGKVIAVTENSLMIEERVLDQDGVWIKRPVTFHLDTMIKPGTEPKEVKKRILKG